MQESMTHPDNIILGSTRTLHPGMRRHLVRRFADTFDGFNGRPNKFKIMVEISAGATAEKTAGLPRGVQHVAQTNAIIRPHNTPPLRPEPVGGNSG
ncbi:MAG: hypothetical protein ACUVQR_13470 [Thermogutta sp.]